MSCNAAGRIVSARRIEGLQELMDNTRLSDTYWETHQARPLTMISVRAAAGDPRRGWLMAGLRAIPVALGRGGIIANKREGDGGTPKGAFRPKRLWWRADRSPRPQTFLPNSVIRSEDAC